ncbi:MAG: DNA polymerase III subunit delta' [Alloprevotella sp.]|nr:DNA polymerase III subunit delta' [Bacteroidales bacterium]MDY4568726.1 DNA polymerase III subunit delta' [Alloprevotella sp.]
MSQNAIIGQTHIKQLLAHMVETERVPHALLFTGEEGRGQIPMALALAEALLCEHPVKGQACGTCPSCHLNSKFIHPDLHFVFPVVKRKNKSDAPLSDQYLALWREALTESRYLGAERWRETLNTENQQPGIFTKEAENITGKISLKASLGGYKVVIVWQAELMNEETANKLLKLLEEPPERTVFILISAQPEHLLTTIVSRTQEIAFPPIPTDTLAVALEQKHGLSPEMAHDLAHRSNGNYIKACSELQGAADNAQDFDMFVLFMRLCYARKIKDLSEWTDRMAERGRERQKAFLDYCQRMLRENFIYNFRRPELNYLNPREADFATRFSPFINERNVIPLMREFDSARRDIVQNTNARMVFFDLSIKTIVLLIR